MRHRSTPEIAPWNVFFAARFCAGRKCLRGKAAGHTERHRAGVRRARQGRAVSRACEAGFTLLELLISMTIVALLAITVLLGWRVAASAWGKATLYAQRSRTVLETNKLLQEQMASMLPYQVWTPQGTPELFFQGESRVARFVSRYALVHRASSGLYGIEYQIADSEDGTEQLLLNEFPVKSREDLGALIGMAPAARGPQTVTLLKGLTGCHFEYYQPATPSQPGAWVENWPRSSRELPAGMAIRIVAPEKGSDLRPVSVVAAIQDISLNTK